MKTFVLLLVLALFLIAAEAGKKSKAARAGKVPANLKCGKICKAQCRSVKSCKKACKTSDACVGAPSEKSCRRQCKVGCSDGTCRTCKADCKGRIATCRAGSCAMVCPASLGKKFMKNPSCKSCMITNCLADE